MEKLNTNAKTYRVLPKNDPSVSEFKSRQQAFQSENAYSDRNFFGFTDLGIFRCQEQDDAKNFDYIQVKDGYTIKDVRRELECFWYAFLLSGDDEENIGLGTYDKTYAFEKIAEYRKNGYPKASIAVVDEFESPPEIVMTLTFAPESGGPFDEDEIL